MITSRCSKLFRLWLIMSKTLQDWSRSPDKMSFGEVASSSQRTCQAVEEKGAKLVDSPGGLYLVGKAFSGG